MKVTFIIKKAAKRYDTESMATIYVRFRNGRQLDSVAPTQLAINPNLWDDKNECVKTKAVCNEEMRTHINEEIRQLKTYIEKVYQQEKEAIDKEWLKTTLDKFYHPEKYFLPEEVVIKPGTSFRTNTSTMNFTRAFMKPFPKRGHHSPEARTR